MANRPGERVGISSFERYSPVMGRHITLRKAERMIVTGGITRAHTPSFYRAEFFHYESRKERKHVQTSFHKSQFC